MAIIYKRNKLISYGFNRRTMSRTTVRHTNQTRAWWTIHAEDAALRKAGSRAKGAKMMVARIMKNGTFSNSKPCSNCQFLIERAGMRMEDVTYTE
jgi:deoxycytidylate deaminase